MKREPESEAEYARFDQIGEEPRMKGTMFTYEIRGYVGNETSPSFVTTVQASNMSAALMQTVEELPETNAQHPSAKQWDQITVTLADGE